MSDSLLITLLLTYIGGLLLFVPGVLRAISTKKKKHHLLRARKERQGIFLYYKEKKKEGKTKNRHLKARGMKA